jgi:MinD-like ATPase involved in chromosome partitioning or flagellar assembly
MSCPHCNEKIDVFKKGGGKKLAEELVLPYLGSIPLDGEIVANSDSGEPVVLSRPDSEAAKAFMRLADNCHKFLNPE